MHWKHAQPASSMQFNANQGHTETSMNVWQGQGLQLGKLAGDDELPRGYLLKEPRQKQNNSVHRLKVLTMQPTTRKL
jgi:hypothetical protein